MICRSKAAQSQAEIPDMKLRGMTGFQQRYLETTSKPVSQRGMHSSFPTNTMISSSLQGCSDCIKLELAADLLMMAHQNWRVLTTEDINTKQAAATKHSDKLKAQREARGKQGFEDS